MLLRAERRAEAREDEIHLAPRDHAERDDEVARAAAGPGGARELSDDGGRREEERETLGRPSREKRRRSCACP
jgi:hypothetical protein